MKIFFVAKRQYNNKDLLDDRFGGYWELPLGLVKLSHTVTGSCLSYQDQKEGPVVENTKGGLNNLTWYSFNAGLIKPLGLIRYYFKTLNLAQSFKPDIICSTSDPLYTILGFWIAQRCHAKFVFDIYDNLETYSAARIPGVMPLFRQAVLKADGAMTMSNLLVELIQSKYQFSGPTEIIEHGSEHHFFHPLDRTDCRKKLGLPENAQIIGTAGALYRNRGVQLLFEAYEQLAKKNNNLHLVISGACDAHLTIPQGQRVHNFGNLPFTKVPTLINALDVAVICNSNSEFGRYSVPQKAHEYVTCKVPLVIANVGALSTQFKNDSDCLYEPDDLNSMINVLQRQLQNKRVIEMEIPSWEELSRKCETFLLKITQT